VAKQAKGTPEFPAPRRISRPVSAGGVTIGGDAPISVQSMAKAPTTDVEGVLEQIRKVHGAAGSLMRVAVPDEASAEALREIVARSPLPIVADIHFDWRLAVAAVEAGVAKLRINPGNIGDDEALRPVIEACAERRVPVRVGVNAGSLERDVLAEYGGATAEALAASALRNVERVRAMGLEDVVVSIKAADVERTVRANRMLAEATDAPLHLGVTEAGIGAEAVVKSAVALGILLAEGIGDTIRVSLTGPPEEEVRVGRMILRSLGLQQGPVLISCPTCARRQIDVEAIAEEVRAMIEGATAPIVVAVMGCEVNGPGEAREADVGVAGSRERAVIFRHGQVVRTVPGDEALEALKSEVRELLRQSEGQGEGQG
jgi:(E)-4-hydroxy-3-methylbut-2-enyl-diphosphate synthase